MSSVVARTAFTALMFSCALPAAAQTGVGDDRVSLPDGPGSIGGLGDNAGINPNMGLMTTSVPLEIPGGFDGITPALSLDYSSGSGNSSVGLGWSMALPTIERMTVRGLPLYTDDDRFVVNGSEQLVQVSAGSRRSTAPASKAASSATPGTTAASATKATGPPNSPMASSPPTAPPPPASTSTAPAPRPPLACTATSSPRCGIVSVTRPLRLRGLRQRAAHRPDLVRVHEQHAALPRDLRLRAP